MDALPIKFPVYRKCCSFWVGSIGVVIQALRAHKPRDKCTQENLEVLTHVNVPSKNVFACISYTSFQIQMSPSKMLHKRNLYAHTDFEKLEGTLVVIYFGLFTIDLLQGLIF